MSIDRVATIALQNRMVGVQGRILAVIVSGSVKLISTGFCRGIDDRSRSPAHLRGCNAGRYLKFSNGVGIRENTDSSELRLVIVDSIQRKVVVRRSLSIGGQPTAA